MNKIEQMRKALSPSTLADLAKQGGEYPGFVVQINPAQPDKARALAELRVHGVIGENDGLTILGSGLVARLKAELLDALF